MTRAHPQRAVGTIPSQGTDVVIDEAVLGREDLDRAGPGRVGPRQTPRRGDPHVPSGVDGEVVHLAARKTWVSQGRQDADEHPVLDQARPSRRADPGGLGAEHGDRGDLVARLHDEVGPDVIRVVLRASSVPYVDAAAE